MKETLRRLVQQAGWTIHRWPANRFDAMGDALHLLRQAGFAPDTIIDVGANRGSWTDLALGVFDAREYHLVEPQTACHTFLERFGPPRFHVHKVALTGEGREWVWMLGAEGNTGAYVAEEVPAEMPATKYPAASLDGLLASRIEASSGRVLLKLDVEGHELQILAPSTRVLQAAEVALLEFQVFEIERNGLPVFADIVAFMASRDFMLYDIAALAERRRDHRLRMGDAVFVRRDSQLAADVRWA